MIETIVILALVLLAAAVGWGLAATHRKASTAWLGELERERLIVHTRDGQTLDGILFRADAGGIVLDPATLLDGPQNLAGAVHIARERIAWIQHPRADGT